MRFLKVEDQFLKLVLALVSVTRLGELQELTIRPNYLRAMNPGWKLKYASNSHRESIGISKV